MVQKNNNNNNKNYNFCNEIRKELTSYNENRLIDKIAFHDKINCLNNVLQIFNVDMFLIPYDLFSEIEDFLINYDEKFYERVIFHLGFNQAYYGTQLLFRRYGFKPNEDVLKEVLINQSIMTGQGKYILKNGDKKGIYYLFSIFNPIETAYKKYKSKCFNNENIYYKNLYIKGLIKGLFLSYTEERILNYFLEKRDLKSIIKERTNFFDNKSYDMLISILNESISKEPSSLISNKIDVLITDKKLVDYKYNDNDFSLDNFKIIIDLRRLKIGHEFLYD